MLYSNIFHVFPFFKRHQTIWQSKPNSHQPPGFLLLLSQDSSFIRIIHSRQQTKIHTVEVCLSNSQANSITRARAKWSLSSTAKREAFLFEPGHAWNSMAGHKNRSRHSMVRWHSLTAKIFTAYDVYEQSNGQNYKKLVTSLDKLHFGFSNKCFHQGTICCVFFRLLLCEGKEQPETPILWRSAQKSSLPEGGNMWKKSCKTINMRNHGKPIIYLIDLIVNSSHFQWVWAHQAAIRPLKCSMVAQKARLGLVNMWPVKFSCPVWSALF